MLGGGTSGSSLEANSAGGIIEAAYSVKQIP